MSTPVVVSRIQNRRGIQSDFNALYPDGFDGSASSPYFADVDPQRALQPGELALCYDTNRLFMGSSPRGTYFEIISGGDPVPLEISLQDNFALGVWSPISGLEFTATPFLTIYYSIQTSDNAFSKNGELIITSVGDQITMTDTGSEINSTVHDINFNAVMINGVILIQYIHDFTVPLIFKTTTLTWSSI